MRLSILDEFLILSYIGLCSTTASSNDVDQFLVDILLDFGSHLLGCLVVLPQTVGKSSIGIGTYIIRSTASQLFQKRLQLLGSERTVQSDGENVSMLHRSQKRIKRLSRQGTSCYIRNRHRKHQRNLSSQFLHRGFCRQNSSFHI